MPGPWPLVPAAALSWGRTRRWTGPLAGSCAQHWKLSHERMTFLRMFVIHRALIHPMILHTSIKSWKALSNCGIVRLVGRSNRNSLPWALRALNSLRCFHQSTVTRALYGTSLVFFFIFSWRPLLMRSSIIVKISQHIQVLTYDFCCNDIVLRQHPKGSQAAWIQIWSFDANTWYHICFWKHNAQCVCFRNKTMQHFST